MVGGPALVAVVLGPLDLGGGNRLGHVQQQLGGARFGDQGVAVAQLEALAVRDRRERLLERRRVAQRHLDHLGVDPLSEQTAGVAAVRRPGRAVVTGRDAEAVSH